MIFCFVKSYGISSDSFELDIPVKFTIPKKFKSFDELGVLSSNNKEISVYLDSIGINSTKRHTFRITRDKVIINIKQMEFDNLKKSLLREEKLKILGIK